MQEVRMLGDRYGLLLMQLMKRNGKKIVARYLMSVGWFLHAQGQKGENTQ